MLLHSKARKIAGFAVVDPAVIRVTFCLCAADNLAGEEKLTLDSAVIQVDAKQLSECD